MLPLLNEEARIIFEPEFIVIPEKKDQELEELKSILSNGKIFLNKMHHGNQNISLNYIPHYHFFKDKANFKGGAI